MDFIAPVKVYYDPGESAGPRLTKWRPTGGTEPLVRADDPPAKAKLSDQKAIQGFTIIRVTNTLLTLKDLHTARTQTRPQKIPLNPLHPAHHLFLLLPSGRRYRTARFCYSQTKAATGKSILSTIRVKGLALKNAGAPRNAFDRIYLLLFQAKSQYNVGYRKGIKYCSFHKQSRCP